MSKRSSAMTAYHRFYRAVEGIACVYCGVRATTKDHFVPISLVRVLTECADMHTGKFLLPCCGECNRIASDSIFKTVAAKRRYIQGRLRTKYSRVLELPAWTEYELEKLSWSMQSYVRAGLAQKAVLLQRLAWRNTSNSSFVEIAKIRSGVLAAGQSSVAQRAVINGTTKKSMKIMSSNDNLYKSKPVITEGGKVHQKTCIECKKDYTAFTSSRIYCGRTCLERAQRNRRNQRKAALVAD